MHINPNLESIKKENDFEDYNSKISIPFTRIKSNKGSYFEKVFPGDLVVLLDTNENFKRAINEEAGKEPYFVNEVYLIMRDACLKIQGSKGVGYYSSWHFQKHILE